MDPEEHTLWPPPGGAPPPGVFAGLRLHLHGARQFTQPFGQLLQHAGEGRRAGRGGA